MNLTLEQKRRYQRNIMLNSIGERGQLQLLNSRVLVIGAGGLGSPVLLYLAAAGVGTLGIIDSDQVELSNLQRQILHGETTLGVDKSASSSERLRAINSQVQVIEYSERFTKDNGAELVSEYGFVVDATDNFESKFLINDLCVKNNVPFNHGGILEFSGQTMTVIPEQSCCYRCVFQEVPEKDVAKKCSQAGVLGSVAGVIGSLQATETLKFLTGTGELLTNRLLTFDALRMVTRTIPLKQREDCICT